MSDTLNEIVARKRSHVGGRMAQRPLRMVEALARDTDSPRGFAKALKATICLLYTSPSPRDGLLSRMPSSA